MTTPPCARLWIDVALNERPVVGSVSSEGAVTQRFSGWIELFASLEATLVALRADPAHRTTGDRTPCPSAFEGSLT